MPNLDLLQRHKLGENQMKFAIVEGERKEAQKGIVGECIGCSHPMTPKCGEKKVHHWAHKTNKPCDHWWEPETQWHRDWKNKFLLEWQEKRHLAEDGEMHIADVKTDKDWVLEFQNSPITPSERNSRNAFYAKLMWVVNGLKRKRDQIRFQEALIHKHSFENNPLMRRLFFVTVNESTLINDWVGSQSPIFFDFNEDVLWCLLPSNPNRGNFVIEFSRQGFVELHRPNEPVDHALNLFKNLDAAAMQLTNHWRSSDQKRELEQQIRNTQQRSYRPQQLRRHFRF